MDAESILALTIGALGAVIAVQAARGARDAEAWRWVAVNALVAITAFGTVAVWPEIALPVTAGVAAVLIVAPLAAAALMRRWMEADNPAGALRIARALTVLLPGPASRDAAAMCEALVLAERDDLSGLASLARSSVPRLRLGAGVLLAQDQGRWSDALDIIQRDVPDQRGFVSAALRSLARLGRVDDMLALYRAHETRMTPSERAACRAQVFQVAGRLDDVRRVLDGRLRHLHSDARTLIETSARHRADPTSEEPLAILRGLATSAAVARVRRAARHLLDDPPSVPTLSPEAQAAIDAIAADVEAEARLAPARWSAAWLTLALLATNIGVHAWVHGLAAPGSETRRLLAAGALWTPYVYEAGEWWRTLSATFLHANLLHLALNMVVLAVFGRIVERFAGPIGYLITYATAGIGAFAGITLLAREGIVEDVLVVGASGALFGLVGALLVTALRWYVVTRSGVHLRQLRRLGILLAAQVAFDLLVPESSMLGHGLGLGIGIVVSASLGPLVWPIKSTPLQNPRAARSYT